MLGNLIKKTHSYIRRNGFRAGFYAALERISQAMKPGPVYDGRDPADRELSAPLPKEGVSFDILVPAYHTSPDHLRQMTESVLAQTYGSFTLMIGDGGACEAPRQKAPGTSMKDMLEAYGDGRVRYVPLLQNDGISGNTNALLDQSQGDYVVLLDHDDMIEPDALALFAVAIEEARSKGAPLPALIYSDEDKCDGEGRHFYEANYKPDFDLDLLLSNNYICHLTAIRGDIARDLRFRSRYDGAQDHDIILRACQRGLSEGAAILHIPHILYHWRCHEASTASNPESKAYAYEAGKACVEDFARENFGPGILAGHTHHRGFFRLEYPGAIFAARQEVGAVCGPVYKGGRILSGALDMEGACPYKGLYRHFSGYMHRAAMQQQTYAGDVRNIELRPELRSLYEELQSMDDRGTDLVKQNSGGTDLVNQDSQGTADIIKKSLLLAQRLHSRGYIIIYDPMKK